MSSKLSGLKKKAIALRLKGYSYNKIIKSLGLKSRGTLSYWFKGLVLSEETKRALEKNIQKASKAGFLSFNKNRREHIDNENSLAQKEGLSLIPAALSKKDLLLVGTALYWGEGTKANSPNPRFAFANSDPMMIEVCLKFVREILGVKESKIRAGIHIYPGINIDKTKKYWASITKLPASEFYIVKQISPSSRGVRKKRTPYGTLHIKVNNRLIFYKIKGMIDGLIESCIK